MRTATTLTTTLLTTATLALSAYAAAPAISATSAAPTTATAETETHRERGVVMECTGTATGRPQRTAYASLYENDRFGHTVQVVLDDDPERSGHREPADVLDGRDVRTSVRVDGVRARITGTARRVGPLRQVQESHDDAGNHIEITGTHRRLRTDLVLTHRGLSYPLTCAPAFAYDLQVSTTPTVEPS